MWKSVLALMLVMALLVTVFVACKKKEETPEESSSTESTESSVESTEDTSDTETSDTEAGNPTQVGSDLPTGIQPDGTIVLPSVPLN